MAASLSLSLIDQYVKEQVEERFCAGDEKKIAGAAELFGAEWRTEDLH